VLKFAHAPFITKIGYATDSCSRIYRERVLDAPADVRADKGGEFLAALYGLTVDAILYGGFAGFDFMNVADVGRGFDLEVDVPLTSSKSEPEYDSDSGVSVGVER